MVKINNIKVISATNGTDLTQEFIQKTLSINYSESLEGEADSISIELKNNENASDYWPDDYFVDREFNLNIQMGLLNCGEFNIDKVDIIDNADFKGVNLEGLSAPITTDPSIYTQVRKVWPLKPIPSILSEMANIANLDLDFLFTDASEVKTKVQVTNEYLFNTFVRLSEKWGAFTKVYKNEDTGNWTVLFIGRADIAQAAASLNTNPLDVLPGRTDKLIIIDKNDKNSLKHTNQQFSLISERKELDISYYDPLKKRTYRKLSKNKTSLFLEKSRRDFEIVRVASKAEADLVSRKVELEPDVIGQLSGQFNPNWISGNIVFVKNYSELRNGYYLIKSSSHTFSQNGRFSTCSIEKLPSLE